MCCFDLSTRNGDVMRSDTLTAFSRIEIEVVDYFAHFLNS